LGSSWEYRAANRVMVPILHVDFTSVAWALGLRNLHIPGRIVPVAGMPYDHARNAAVQQFLQSDCSHLFFLDSDVIPPSDAILRLLARNVPVVSGMYCRRSPPHGIPVAIKNGTWLTNFRKGEVVEVDYVGAGCLLVRRDVFEALPPSDAARNKHWFDWRVDMAGLVPQGEAVSEDFRFCQLVREKLNTKILLDTSIECRHCGFAQATLGNLLPLESLPVT
jgi:hypothetical protein